MSALSTAPAKELAPRLFSRTPEDFDVPLGREEEWRCTPIKKLQDFFQVQTWGTVGVSLVPYVEVVAMNDPRLNSTWMPTDRVSAIAYSQVEKAILISVPENQIVEQSIVVNLAGPMLNNYAHIEVQVGKFSRSQIVIIHDSTANVSR